MLQDIQDWAARQRLSTSLCKMCGEVPNVFLGLGHVLPAILSMLYYNQLASASTSFLRPSGLNYFRNSPVTKEISIVIYCFKVGFPQGALGFVKGIVPCENLL